ncbi:LysR family transcriptional regulator [Rhodococcoides trifolii]|uniref:LysR family transcriptional regulator n=1 Tax=Rhodococcoides trifolii TaxID=908250 RepID=A0A917G8J3_9NOCA|nr:LysR substrate-binding domain-containing protein [Rhodococcus trifolii]GGG28301.1 LysR family transcriptional regulator [Rhodococcus trifolii]
MELRQLEYFVAVAEEANFTRAAERVHISQSGVSAQIRQLERELGAELIDRTGRAATLTAAGDAALEHARAALASADATRRAVDEVTGMVRGRLDVGMVTACTLSPFFDATAAFHRSHPGIELSLTEGNSTDLLDDVRRGSLDTALVGVAERTPPDLASLTVFSERIVAAVPPGHPLLAVPSPTLIDVCAHPIVCLPFGTGVRTVFEKACAAEALTARVTLQASAPAAVADLAARGLGVAVLSETIATDYTDTLVAIALDVGIASLLALVWRPAVSPALGRFVEHCRAAF